MHLNENGIGSSPDLFFQQVQKIWSGNETTDPLAGALCAVQSHTGIPPFEKFRSTGMDKLQVRVASTVSGARQIWIVVEVARLGLTSRVDSKGLQVCA